MIGLVLALQAATWSVTPTAPHVGDTVVMARMMAAPAGTTLRVEPLAATADWVPLSAPRVIPRGDSVLVVYTVALFRTGRVSVPLLGDSVRVTVASVLPSSADPDSLAPEPSAAPLAMRWRRLERTAIPLAAAVLLVGGWALWRRRPRRAPRATGSDTPEPTNPTGRWLAAGEPRVAAAWGLARIRQAALAHVPEAHEGLDLATWRSVVGVLRPEWPLRRLDDLLDRIERARFAPLGVADVDEMLVEVEELVEEMNGGRVEVLGKGEKP